MTKRFKMEFDFWGLILFMIIMVPNFIWFAVPAPNDILRMESVTPIVDGIGGVAQAVFVAAICLVQRIDVEKLRFSKLIIATLAMVVIYGVGWILYYLGIVNPGVVLLLTVPPCMAFLLFSLDRKNVIATVPVVIFTICHVIYAFVNYIIKY